MPNVCKTSCKCAGDAVGRAPGICRGGPRGHGFDSKVIGIHETFSSVFFCLLFVLVSSVQLTDVNSVTEMMSVVDPSIKHFHI